MKWYGIVNRKRDARLLQRSHQMIAAVVIAFQRILVKNVRCKCRGNREFQKATVTESPIIESGGGTTGGNILVQMFQLNIQYGSLQCIQTGVDAYALMMVFHGSSMRRNPPNTFRQIIVLHKESSAIAIASKIFRWEKRHATHVTHSAGLLQRAIRKADSSPYGLASILHHIQVVFAGDVENSFHIRTLSKKMNGNDGLGTFGYRRLQLVNIHIESIPPNIHEDGFDPKECGRFSGSHKSKRHRHNLVTGFQAQSHQRNHNSVSATATGNYVPGTRINFQCALKGGHLRPVDKTGLGKHTPNRRIHFLLAVQILIVEINHLHSIHPFQIRAQRYRFFCIFARS